MTRLAWIAFALAIIGAASVSGALMHSYDQARHDKVVADLRAEAAATLAKETNEVLARLQAAIDRNAELEANYVRLSQDTARAQADGVRLSADLNRAVERVRQLTRAGGGSGGRADGQTGTGAGGCADVRAALARTLDAMELLKEGGDRAAELGQQAVDVATIAAKDARDREAARLRPADRGPGRE